MSEWKQTAPTHEEIMTKWWKDMNVWYRISKTDGVMYFHDECGWVGKAWFINRKSADIPPEA